MTLTKAVGWLPHKGSMQTMASDRRALHQIAIAPQPKPIGYRGESDNPFLDGAGGVRAHRETSEYMPTIESHVSVPWAQAIRGGFLFGLVGAFGMAGLLYMLARWGDWRINIWDFLIMVMAAFVSFFLYIAWKVWNRQVDFFSDAILKVEEFTRTDINQDGVVGDPQDHTPVEVNMSTPLGSKSKVLADLPGGRDLQWFAFEVLHPDSGVNFSHHGAEKAKFYSRSKFTKLSQIFLSNEWAVHRNKEVPQAGLALTGEGKQVLYGLAQGLRYKLPEDINLEADAVILDDGQLPLARRYTPIEGQ